MKKDEAARKNFHPRTLMQHAVEAMRLSVAETRADGKVPPKVGAVLWKPDGNIQSASRGELRDGDHAEFTLLERKNRDNKLDGCVLFATLEPCAPGARREPKVCCAERIVNARIKEVWVGIEDPDPSVDRRGIKFLQESGVDVHLFDRDFQELIAAENKLFLEQAYERAQSIGDEPALDVKLSALEEPRGIPVSELSPDALTAYRSIANIADEVSSTAFTNRLAAQGLLKRNGDACSPTGFGLLLFGREPRISMPQAGLLGTIHRADGTEEIEDFDGPQVLVPERALRWLRDKLSDPIDRSEAHRVHTNHALYELVREGIVNALVHRDYDIAGAKCHLVVEGDTIEIRSPGAPVTPITIEQMQAFTAPMLSRNPALHYVFAQMVMAEERGLGLRSLVRRARDAGLPAPRYAWDAPYLTLTLYRRTGGVLAHASPEALARLNADERRGLELVARLGSITRRVYGEGLGFDDRKAQRHLRRFVELGLVQSTGGGPTTAYRLSIR